jgi:hypothetical protein
MTKLIVLGTLALVVVGFAFYGLAGSSKREDKSDTAGSSGDHDGHVGGD